MMRQLRVEASCARAVSPVRMRCHGQVRICRCLYAIQMNYILVEFIILLIFLYNFSERILRMIKLDISNVEKYDKRSMTNIGL